MLVLGSGARTLETGIYSVRVIVMGQHNMRLLEEASFGACIQLDAPMCSEYHGVLSLMVGPSFCRTMKSWSCRRQNYLIKVTKRTGNVLTGVDPIGNIVQLNNLPDTLSFEESETLCLHRVCNPGGGELMILHGSGGVERISTADFEEAGGAR
eukprot:2105749-Amphidinium_carterae.1